MEKGTWKTSPKRPVGVTLVALLLGFWGLTISFIVATLILSWFGGAHVQFEVVTDVLGVGNLPLAWSLWKLKPWAYLATFLLQGAFLLNCLAVTLFLPMSANTKTLQSASLFPVMILIYFLVDRNIR